MPDLIPNIHIPRSYCRDFRAAVEREWHVTNGLGGYATGTLCGALTRKYHGLLIAALQPPLGRTLLATKLDETARVAGRAFKLYANVWKGGAVENDASLYLRRFDVRLGIPTWRFEFGGCRLQKRIWMEPGRNATFVHYELAPDAAPCELDLRLLVNYRDHHANTPAESIAFQTVMGAGRIEMAAGTAPARLVVAINPAAARRFAALVAGTWHRDFHLEIEQERGYDFLDNNFHAADLRVELLPGRAVELLLTTAADEPHVAFEGALSRREAHARGLLRAAERFRQPEPEPASAGHSGDHAARSNPPRNGRAAVADSAEIDDCLPMDALVAGGASALNDLPIAQLVLAADQFIAARPTPSEPDGHTIIAGFPWFSDWGRDTMISLPGLTLMTGRPELARQILRTWVQYVDRGMIPNRFPDEGGEIEYHTGDATLWYLWAIEQYVRHTGDLDTLRVLLPAVEEIIAWHRRGTRHNIRVDADGLLSAGEEGVNLTWMDAKVHGRVITPRIGKAVELSALWYSGLLGAAELLERVDRDGAEYRALAEQTRASFVKFWNPEAGCLLDVLDGPYGRDPAIRPNQIFAVSLPRSPLTADQQRSVVAVCERELLTWRGLRSLSPDHRDYRPYYRGELIARDEAYHQGTAWGWLLGPFVLAHYRVHSNRAAARAFLRPMLAELGSFGVGSLAEVFDATEPFLGKGCFAQAWSVAETLRAWRVTQGV